MHLANLLMNIDQDRHSLQVCTDVQMVYLTAALVVGGVVLVCAMGGLLALGHKVWKKKKLQEEQGESVKQMMVEEEDNKVFTIRQVTDMLIVLQSSCVYSQHSPWRGPRGVWG